MSEVRLRGPGPVGRASPAHWARDGHRPVRVPRAWESPGHSAARPSPRGVRRVGSSVSSVGLRRFCQTFDASAPLWSFPRRKGYSLNCDCIQPVTDWGVHGPRSVRQRGRSDRRGHRASGRFEPPRVVTTSAVDPDQSGTTFPTPASAPGAPGNPPCLHRYSRPRVVLDNCYLRRGAM